MIVSGKATIGNVLIYSCEGTIPSSCEALKNELSRFPHNSIEFANSGELAGKSWGKRTDLLVLPGGVCSRWEVSLGCGGLEKIRNFVLADGGKILGVCAGSYFLSQKSLYESGSVRIEKERPYSIFPGLARGPITRSYESTATAPQTSGLYPAGCPDLAIAIDLATPDETRGACYYQGGPVIGPKSPETERELIASFDGAYEGDAITGFLPNESESAGAVVLCSPHIEYGAPRSRSPFEPSGIRTLFDQLDEHEAFRQELLNRVVHFLFNKFDDDSEILSPKTPRFDG
jgi:glutamine amidotransferase-like uncharacterized protein